MSMKTVKRVSIVDSIVEQLLEAIRLKQFSPGDKIPPERELAIALGVSRTALREAVKRLESLGVLTVRQGDGTYVNNSADQRERVFRQEMQTLFSIGDVNVRDFVEARLLIESKAVALAAERCTDEELAQLEELQKLMEKNLENREEFLRYDMEFHRFLLRISGNPVLLRFAWSIEDLLREQIRRSVTTHENLQDACEAHVHIVKALRAKNPLKAEQALRNHLDKIAVRLLSAVLNRTRSEEEGK